VNVTQKVLAAAAVALVAGLGVGYGIRTLREPAPASTTAPGVTAAKVASRQPLYWYDPMYPQQHFDKPGKSPFMDMPLVPKYADSSTAGTGGVTVDPRVAQNLAVRYATVERTRVGTSIEAPASVVFNERDVAIVQARAAGYVERVYARAPGDVIAAGAPLADLLVPEWSGLQIEYEAVKKHGDVALIAAVRQRMQLAGMPDALLIDIERSGQARPIITIRSPLAGVIQELSVRAGMNVAAGATLARVNGLSPVWIEAAVPAPQAGSMVVGQDAEVIIEGATQAGRVGKVVAILPEVNRESRTVRARVELPNPRGTLRPGMFGVVRFKSAATEALTVPSEAVIRSAAGARVIVADADGRMRPVAVELGVETGGRVTVSSGVREGDRVVASGQFLFDSEANLSGALERLTPGKSGASSSATPSAGPVLHRGRGTVNGVADGKLTLAHGPVPSLNWPSMTMTFGLSSADLATKAAPGDTVDFTFAERNGEYVVQELRKVQP
jgi:Cu(I)/Ag(I) efflux system membrane fusion protein